MKKRITMVVLILQFNIYHLSKRNYIKFNLSMKFYKNNYL